jgi:hypothetical protein
MYIITLQYGMQHRSRVRPWDRGDKLHLAAKNLEGYMDMLNAAQRNRHLEAGQRLWYSKLAVHQLGKEQMRSLTAEVEQLVEHGFSIAVLIVARPRGPCSMASWSMVWSHAQ